MYDSDSRLTDDTEGDLDTSSTVRNTRIRIDFVVRETCDDGSVPEEELRFVRFGDEMHACNVKEFFLRSAEAMSVMFRPGATVLVKKQHVEPYKKIQAIKALRAVVALGLKRRRISSSLRSVPRS